MTYSACLMSQAARMFLTGKAPYPIERTLLTTGFVAAGVQSLATGQKRIETPHLAVRYRAPRESSFFAVFDAMRIFHHRGKSLMMLAALLFPGALVEQSARAAEESLFIAKPLLRPLPASRTPIGNLVR